MSAVLMNDHRAFAPFPLPRLRAHTVVAALVTVALHGLVLALLLAQWPVDTPPAPHVRTISMQLLALPPPAPPAPDAPPPVVAVEPPAPAVTVPEPTPVDPRIEQRKIEQAALAHKRQQAREAQRQRERLERQRQAQARLEQEQEQQQREPQRLDAEQQRRQAAEAAQAARQAEAAAAASRPYLPIAKQAPAYPQRALDKGIQGECTVSYTVNAQGRVEDPQVVGDCHPLFIRPSLTAAKTFRYQPRVIEGHAVAVPHVKNTFTYRIE